MSTKAFFSKGWPTRFAFLLGKYLPSAGAGVLASLAARVLVSFSSDVRAAVYANQQHILGEAATPKAVRRNAYAVFCNATRAYYELFHNVGRGHSRVADFNPPVRLLPETRAHLDAALAAGRGVFILGSHIANFDLAGIALCQEAPVPLQVLSLSNPSAGVEMFNRLRQQAGAMVTPITPEALRQAIRRLQGGGAVITGVDRPVGEGDAPVEFFGEIAQLPVGYMRIALRSNCLLMTATCFYEEGEYRVVANPPWELSLTGDRDHDILVNVRKALIEIEGLIRQHPEQWLMFVPVWR